MDILASRYRCSSLFTSFCLLRGAVKFTAVPLGLWQCSRSAALIVWLRTVKGIWFRCTTGCATAVGPKTWFSTMEFRVCGGSITSWPFSSAG